jgi:hypothetical protein
MPSVSNLATQEAELADEVAKYYADPYGFVLAMFPWGEAGTPLAEHSGPDEWQRRFLTELGEEVARNGFDGKNPVRPIRRAVSSGHGIGKSTLVAWVVLWIMSTRPFAHGTVTANSFDQLRTKTWAAIKHWSGLCLTGHWFRVGDTRMYHLDHKDSWFCAPQSSKEENSEAFAGQHAADSTSFYIFDEDSAIPDKIHEVAEGGLTDGEPMIFCFGNPTRSNGHFYRACFGAERDLWNPTVIDSRECLFTNKVQLQEWVDRYGEDSDFVRVRVRGMPPSASDLQFIDSEAVYAAQKRDVVLLGDEPLVAGLDLARGGGDENVLRFRKGTDARSIPPIRIPGEEARNSMRLVTVVADALGRDYGGQRIHTLFVDATGGSVGGPIGDRLRQMGHSNVVDIGFSEKAPEPEVANMRAYMWSKMRDWLRSRGCIDKAPDLEIDLTGPGYHADKQDRLVLESKEDMKKRGLDSPDDGDALALTFAMPVGVKKGPKPPRRPAGNYAWT